MQKLEYLTRVLRNVNANGLLYRDAFILIGLAKACEKIQECTSTELCKITGESKCVPTLKKMTLFVKYSIRKNHLGKDTYYFSLTQTGIEKVSKLMDVAPF